MYYIKVLSEQLAYYTWDYDIHFLTLSKLQHLWGVPNVSHGVWETEEKAAEEVEELALQEWRGRWLMSEGDLL